jgi:hypothetical protein
VKTDTYKENKYYIYYVILMKYLPSVNVFVIELRNGNYLNTEIQNQNLRGD